MKKGRSPRHAIKKLIKAGDGLSNPTPECTIEICYTGKLTGSGEIFDDAYAEGPNRSGARTMQFKDPSMPSGFWMVVETMREGEKAEAILHHKAAFGAEGNAALGVPPPGAALHMQFMTRLRDAVRLSLKLEPPNRTDWLTA